VKVRILIKVLSSYGFTLDRTKGSHKIFRKAGYTKTLSIPCHNDGDEARQYLINLVREAVNLTADEFLKELKKY
jgi:predicted RNA binding protein YcfA (HicA-like mRNA interferase family)